MYFANFYRLKWLVIAIILPILFLFLICHFKLKCVKFLVMFKSGIFEKVESFFLKKECRLKRLSPFFVITFLQILFQLVLHTKVFLVLFFIYAFFMTFRFDFFWYKKLLHTDKLTRFVNSFY